MGDSNYFKYILEFAAVLPLVTIGLGGIYYHSFYDALGLNWLFSQGSVSTILLSSIPLFFKIITGSTLAILLNFTFFKSAEYFWGICTILGITLGAVVGNLMFLGFSWNNLIEVFQSYLFIMYSFAVTLTFFQIFETNGFERNLIVGVFAIFLLLTVPIINFQANEQATDLLAGKSKFSKVLFNNEGLKKIPITYTITDNSGTYRKDIDWRILEVNGDKVVIIAINVYQKINGKNKNAIKIIEYKDIDFIY